MQGMKGRKEGLDQDRKSRRKAEARKTEQAGPPGAVWGSKSVATAKRVPRGRRALSSLGVGAAAAVSREQRPRSS